jgi:hypothetical protein
MATRTTSKNSASPAAADKTKPAKPAKAATEAPKETVAAKEAAGDTAAAPRARSAAKKDAAPAAAAPQVTSEQRRQFVAEAAYFIAERRGFAGGTEHQDWLEAEALIDRMLAAGQTPR